MQHPRIQAVAVVTREEETGSPYLAAYLVVSSPLYSDELRRFLKEKLPDYMVPSVFTFLEALPRTPNGKVNRRALPEPDSSQRVASTPLVPPTTALETKLSQIWCELLKLEKISIHDNFFELGGHSLLATQVVAQIRAEFQVELSLVALFEQPTIAELAHKIISLGYVEPSHSKINETNLDEMMSLFNDLETFAFQEVQQFLEDGTQT